MAAESTNESGHAYQAVVTGLGILLWLLAVAVTFTGYAWRDQLAVLVLTPLVVVISLFPHVFPMPAGLKFTNEQMTFNLSDAFILLVGCWYGFAPAVLIGGVEGFTSSRRAVRRLSSNLFSLGMMSLAAAAASAVLGAALRFGFGQSGAGSGQNFLAVAVAMLAAGLTHMVVNMGLLSTLLALRHGTPVLRTWKENLLWTAPMFLPSSAAASSMYLALQQGSLLMLVIGAPILLAIYFGHRQHRNSMQERVELMERAQQERIAVMGKAHRQTIEALAVAINAKDEVTHEHVLRVQIYAAGVARLLGCDETEVEALRAGALLHDIGKIAVPDYILNKPGKLTAAEFEKMKLHTVAGAQILGRVEFPYPVVPVVRHHHERWDGRGYPDGLRGEGIPLTARILSVVDCFDAVREDRQYRRGLTREEAINLIMEGSGTQYDPRVVGTFVTHLPEFEAEILAHRDTPAPSYGIEPMEQLSEAALKVAPAAGLAEEDGAGAPARQPAFSREEREALDDLARALAAARSAEEVAAALAGGLGPLAPFDSCAVTLAAKGTGENVVTHAAGEHAALLAGRAVTLGEGVTGWVLANRKPFYNTDPKLDLPPHLASRFAGYRTLAVAPLLKDGEMYGAVSLYSASLAEYGADHQRRIEQAAATTASALAALNDGAAGDLPRGFRINAAGEAKAPLGSPLTH